MEKKTKEKIKAGAKIVFGAARIVTGLITATGHGLVGAYLRNHHMQGAALRLGKASAEAGGKMLDEGVKDWEKADK